MGVLSWLFGRRLDRRRGVLAADPVDAAEPQQRVIPKPPDTAGTARLERPQPTPSMRIPGVERTAGTPEYRFPGGTPSTERLHNPTHHGR